MSRVTILKTPNRAADVRGLGRDAVQCVGLAACGRCPNWSRWLLVDDQGAELRVCRLHANKAERAGQLAVCS